MNKKNFAIRLGIYLVGMVILALGLTLNTQVNLGVATIISIAETYHLITGLNSADSVFLLYCVLVAIQIIIHVCRKTYRAIIIDILQLPLSVVFTRFMKLFLALIPSFKDDLAGTWAGTIPGRLLFLALAIIFTGIGAATTLNMRLIPNPGDGIVQANADCIHKGTGFSKNCVDICCVIIACIMGLIFMHKIPGSVNIGTLCAMLLTGRVIAIFNKFMKAPMEHAAGLDIPKADEKAPAEVSKG